MADSLINLFFKKIFEYYLWQLCNISSKSKLINSWIEILTRGKV